MLPSLSKDEVDKGSYNEKICLSQNGVMHNVRRPSMETPTVKVYATNCQARKKCRHDTKKNKLNNYNYY